MKRWREQQIWPELNLSSWCFHLGCADIQIIRLSQTPAVKEKSKAEGRCSSFWIQLLLSRKSTLMLCSRKSYLSLLHVLEKYLSFLCPASFCNASLLWNKAALSVWRRCDIISVRMRLTTTSWHSSLNLKRFPEPQISYESKSPTEQQTVYHHRKIHKYSASKWC